MCEKVRKQDGMELSLEHEFHTGDKVVVRVKHNPTYSREEVTGMLEIAFMEILSQLDGT